MRYSHLYIPLLLICSFVLSSCQQNKDRSLADSRFYTDSIYSSHLEEYRKHTVYLPKSYDSTQTYPIIYATDGDEPQNRDFIKQVLDSLIGANAIRPVIYIGSHANINVVPGSQIQTEDGQTFSMQYRFFEYVEIDREQGMQEAVERFENHMNYFTKELIPIAEKAFNPGATSEDRIFYGYSNGAGFGANLLNKHPTLIGTFICFSTVGSNVGKNAWDMNIKYPDLYLQYGDQETGGYVDEPTALKGIYEKSASFYELKTYEGGHEIAKWNEEFGKTIQRILNDTYFSLPE